MAYQRGTKESYDLWAKEVGDNSYSWDSFLPYLQKSVHYTAPDQYKRAVNATPSVNLSDLGWDGPVSVTFSNYAQAISSWVQKGLSEIGIKPRDGFTSGSLFGSSYVLESIVAETQTRETSETAFLQPALPRGNLITFQHSMAQRIILDNNKTANGVSVITDGKEYTLNARKEVVLSAGTFQSPQLLMVSGIGPKDTLSQFNISVVADRPGVGQNMWVSNIRFSSRPSVGQTLMPKDRTISFSVQAIV